MFISNSSTRSSHASDVTAHVQQYVHGEIDKLTGSAVNNMLFLTSREDRHTIFVYKYYEQGGKLQQSAWFKWSFNGIVYSAFAIGSSFYLMIRRHLPIVISDWIMGDGYWDMDKEWILNGYSPWIMDEDNLANLKLFEKMDLIPRHQSEQFLDVGNTPIESYVDFGEWVKGSDGKKEIRGSLLFKTIQISDEDESRYDLWIYDKRKGTERKVASKYIKNRKPYISGDAKNMKVGIRTNKDDTIGFRITTVSFEGNLNRRAKAH
jgi:hypothetical protein